MLAPGSLYTSIVAVLCVPEIRAAIERAPGRVVQIANLAVENESTGLDGTEHLAAVREHGGRVDQFMYDPDHGLAVDPAMVSALGVEPVAASIAGPTGSGRSAHDPQQLAKALSALL